MALDHEGEISKSTTVQIVNGFGFHNAFPISPLLQVSGFATNGVFAGDFGSTGQIFVYSTTPGVSIIAQSGHDYSLAAVPEPETWALLALGTLLGARTLSRKSARPFG